MDKQKNLNLKNDERKNLTLENGELSAVQLVLRDVVSQAIDEKLGHVTGEMRDMVDACIEEVSRLEKEVKNPSGEPRTDLAEAVAEFGWVDDDTEKENELKDKLARTYDSLLYVMSKYDEWYKEHGKNLQYSKVKKIRTAWESLKFCRRSAGAKLTWLKRWEKNDG
jgi:hypothetical protein